MIDLVRQRRPYAIRRIGVVDAVLDPAGGDGGAGTTQGGERGHGRTDGYGDDGARLATTGQRDACS